MAISIEKVPARIRNNPEKLGALIIADKLLDAVDKIAVLEKEIEALKLKISEAQNEIVNN